MELPPVVESVLELFADDNGITWTEGAKFYAKGLWDGLSSSAQTFLLQLTPEDLSNVTIGETREDGADTLRLFNGQWQMLPAEVDKFLFLLWDVLELGDPDMTED